MKRHIKQAVAVFLAVTAIYATAACLKKGKVFEADAGTTISSWYSLKLGEKLNVSRMDQVLRVPGGWLYMHQGPYAQTMAFIPYSDEGLR